MASSASSSTTNLGLMMKVHVAGQARLYESDVMGPDDVS